ncbi:nuclear transport factor 2 family protein [Pedobacter miscanthi]|uniref:SnoaL-like domain-containing protein n=1 Tax=Pedobacter miscanthi TaxID=2259170 RepID=A0A366KYY4_9SPHI|nr:nuclear transport factor 2 family protein [Pedobacter miscanthi]RBQ06730.1 hypothetical protein DRW42_13185 [Pedobacter miscanthi]
MKNKISDERAIENLMVAYAFANDDADIARLGELFKDATFWIDQMSAKGKEEISAVATSMIQVLENGRSATTHEITNIIIEIAQDGLSASAQAYWTLYKTVSGEPRTAVMSGRYSDKFTFGKDNWHFLERKASVLWQLEKP